MMSAHKTVQLSSLILSILILLIGSIDAQRGFHSYKIKIPGTDVQLKMIPIKEGNFNMGSTYSAVNSTEDERPIHHVELDRYWMAEHETTWELYNLFLDQSVDSLKRQGTKNPMVIIDINQIPRPETDQDSIDLANTDDYPAANISQAEASAFCEWLTAMTGHYYRLPTEAEWEYACRAHRESEYHFDKTENIEVYSWNLLNSDDTPHAVKGKKSNRWKLYDMNGNVAEWTLDNYNTSGYDSHTIKNPVVIENDKSPAAIRGGSWEKHPSLLRCGARDSLEPKWEEYDDAQEWKTRSETVGFRVVRPYFMPITVSEREALWVHKTK